MKRFRLVAAVLIIAGLTTYNVFCLAKAQVLTLRIKKADVDIAKLEAQRKANFRLFWFASEAYKQLNSDNKRTQALLNACAAREDFPVRSGPRIAWCDIAGASSKTEKMCIFLPAGRHRLKCAIGDVSKMSERFEVGSATARSIMTKGRGPDRKEFQTCNPQQLACDLSCLVDAGPQVFDVGFVAGESEGPLRLTVIGEDGSTIHDRELSVTVGASTVRTSLPKYTLIWPSQVQVEDSPLRSSNNRRSSHKRRSAPVTDLGLVQISEDVTGRQFDLRLWIESDSAPCMPAAEVAADYPTLVKRLAQHGIWSEGDDLFIPYDGSGCLYFHPEMFLKP